MRSQISLALLFHTLASVARGSLVHDACLDLTVPVEIDTEVLTFNIVPFANTYESKGFLVKSIARNSNPAAILGPPAALYKTYNIAISYCKPLHQNSKGITLQILSHGIGFDKSLVWSNSSRFRPYWELLNFPGQVLGFRKCNLQLHLGCQDSWLCNSFLWPTWCWSIWPSRPLFRRPDSNANGYPGEADPAG